MKYNREAERDARREALRQAGYNNELRGKEREAALRKADEIFREYLDECRLIEDEEDDFIRMGEVKYRRKAV